VNWEEKVGGMLEEKIRNMLVFTPEQVSIFGVNIPKIKQEADQIIEETLKRK
jgi:hypothetical protein